jgi:hypothetical protein
MCLRLQIVEMKEGMGRGLVDEEACRLVTQHRVKLALHWWGANGTGT